MNSYPLVSVIIPVKNQTAFLCKCLSALMAQTYPRNRYEVIVINNDPTQELPEIKKKFKDILLLHENKPGASAARNKGLSKAAGSIIAFTDADCIPAKNWIFSGVQALIKNHPASIVGGPIFPVFTRIWPPTSYELYDFINFLDQEKFSQKLGFLATASLFTYKKLFDKHGNFNETLKVYGEDKDWCQRVLAKGYTIHFEKKIIIRHHCRNSLSQIASKTIQIINNEYLLNPTYTYTFWIKRVLIMLTSSIRNALCLFLVNIKSVGSKSTIPTHYNNKLKILFTEKDKYSISYLLIIKLIFISILLAIIVTLYYLRKTLTCNYKQHLIY